VVTSPEEAAGASGLDVEDVSVLDNCQDVIDSIPKLMRDEKNIKDTQKDNELFSDVCESLRYGVMSYANEQAIPREVEIQREIMSIKDNTQKYQRYLELSSRPRLADIAFTITRGRRWRQIKSS
jgi:hypothetical protein